MTANPFQLDNLQFWLLNAPFFLLLLLLSICSISLIVEKLLLLRRWRCRSQQLATKISNCLKEDKLAQLNVLIKNEHGPEATLLRKSFHFIKYELELPQMRNSQGLARDKTQQDQHADIEYSDLVQLNAAVPNRISTSAAAYQSEHQSQINRLEHWIETCIEELSLQLEKHSSLFHLIANVSTLIGLLGTVTGMIYAFQNGALAQSTQLAQGISQALVTTAGGLIVAIPAIVSQQLFLNASSLRVSTLEKLGHDILFFQYKRFELQRNHFSTNTPEGHERVGNIYPRAHTQPNPYNTQLDYSQAANNANNSARDLAELRQSALLQRSGRLTHTAQRQPLPEVLGNSAQAGTGSENFPAKAINQTNSKRLSDWPISPSPQNENLAISPSTGLNPTSSPQNQGQKQDHPQFDTMPNTSPNHRANAGDVSSFHAKLSQLQRGREQMLKSQPNPSNTNLNDQGPSGKQINQLEGSASHKWRGHKSYDSES